MLTQLLLWSILSGTALPDGLSVPDPAQLVEIADQAALSGLRHTAQHVLGELGIEGTVSARVKSVESLRAKMARKGVALSEVHDRLAARIIVADEADCYRVLDALTERFDVVSGELDDYIAHPKPSGYQSLHVAVRTQGQTAEYQIRTAAMHDVAEHGSAAHWQYKKAQMDTLVSTI